MGFKPIVLVTEPISAAGLTILEKTAQLLVPWRDSRSFNEQEISEADAVIVRLVKVDESLLNRAPRLKVVGRHGAGVDNVDLPAATVRRIPVVYTPSANSNAVAEHALLLLLSLARNLRAADHAVRAQRFDLRDSLVGSELRGKTIGIVGLGSIGTLLAGLCYRGFAMHVLAFDPFVNRDAVPDYVTLTDTLHQLLTRADAVSLHVPLNATTHHMIDARALEAMKAGAFLVNTSRGAVVDTVALAGALEKKRICGAALDVFEEEPLPAGHPLLSAPRTLFTPHLASSTMEARDGMAEMVATQVLQVLQGHKPDFVANPQVYAAKL
jgi:D-3-phosphoglycerate dehydrogenase